MQPRGAQCVAQKVGGVAPKMGGVDGGLAKDG